MAKGFEAAYAACRGPVRHAWDHIPADGSRRPQFGTLALFRCIRCGTERHDIFSRATGELLHRSYRWPEGYKDVDRRTSAEWRALWSNTVSDLLDADELQTRRRKRA